MRKYILLVLFSYLIQLNAEAQQYQRMFIPSVELQGLSLAPGAISEGIKARCLDKLRDAPGATTSLNNILSGSHNVKIKFTDNNEIVSLTSLLGKPGGIELSGSTQEDAMAMILEYESTLHTNPNEIPPFRLHLKNNTNRPLEIICNGNIQVGQIKEPAMPIHGNVSEQNEIWLNTNLLKFSELGYMPEKECKELISTTSISEREEALGKCIEKFESKYNLNQTGKLTGSTETKFKSIYNSYLSKQIQIKQQVKQTLEQYNIGIKGTDADELYNYYLAANNAGPHDITDISTAIRTDYAKGIFYQYNATTNTYLKVIKGKKLKGMYFKYTPYTLRNFGSIEDGILNKKISANEILLLNFLDKGEDYKTFSVMGELFANRQFNFSPESLSELKKKIKTDGIKYVFCFGHYKPGEIFTQVKGQYISYKLDYLNDLASKLDIKLFFMGCESSFASGGGTGTTVKTNSIRNLKSLAEAMNTSDSWGQLLNNYAKHSGYNVNYEVDETTEQIKAVFYEHSSSKNGTTNSPVNGEPQVIIIFPKIYFPFMNYNNDTDDDK